MNNTTPPPPGRVHTPPTPLHGPKYDPYEPYSPRRSSRLHAKREQSPLATGKAQTTASNPQSAQRAQSKHSHLHGSPNSNAVSTPRKRPTIKRTSSQHISPPSSPLSPSQDPASTRSKPQSKSTRPQNSIASVRRRYVSPPTLTSILETPVSHRRANKVSARDGSALQAMLPTPAKTPRKRQNPDEPLLSSTARVLFPHLPATVDEAMPSPRKARKARHAGFTLDSLDDDAEHRDGKIQIYTDSKERIPTDNENDDEDNPFVTRRGTRSSKSKVSQKQSSSKTKYGMSKEIDEAVERGEGIVYVFRGKKMFRPIEQPEAGLDDEMNGANDIANSPGTAELRKRAGAAAAEPVPRTSVKPRLLFPPKESSPDPADIDEEAITDIEAQQDADNDHNADSDELQIITPVKTSFYPATPPTTARKRKQPLDATPRLNPDEDTSTARHGRSAFSMGLDGGSDYLRLPKMRNVPGVTSPFDSWPRTKPGIRSTSASAAGSSSPDAARSPRARGAAAKRQAEL